MEGDLVDERPVRVQPREVTAGQVRQLGTGGDRGDLAAPLAAPQRQRRAPVARARQRPVDVVGQPVAVAAVADVLGVPVDAGVDVQQAVAQLRGGHVPRRHRVVEQGRLAAPAERIGVLVGPRRDQQPRRVEHRHDLGVGVLDELPGQRLDAPVEAALGVDGVEHRQPVLARPPRSRRRRTRAPGARSRCPRSRRRSPARSRSASRWPAPRTRCARPPAPRSRRARGSAGPRSSATDTSRSTSAPSPSDRRHPLRGDHHRALASAPGERHWAST